eukprot:137177_1
MSTNYLYDIEDPIIYVEPDNNSSFKPDASLFNILNNKKSDNVINNNSTLQKRMQLMNEVNQTCDELIVGRTCNSNQDMVNKMASFLNDDIYALNPCLIPTVVICGQNNCLIISHLETKLTSSINSHTFVRFNEEYLDKIDCIANEQKVLIIIENIERWFTTNILTLLIYTLHNSQSNAKFALILGTSTDHNLIQKMIEPNALRHLKIKYCFEPSNNLYSELTEEILIDKLPILFSHNILNVLVNNSSTTIFKHQIKYLLVLFFSD